ncbi:hypothetical protein N431DRAFT_437795 [Stipitochalara longipes BDJ]|nr:hypothetical protein N431DRAFT_437795 [Stipitochalara longipes BDJ]
MATKTLPKTPFQLHGGCFCTAIRYTISIPKLSERKELPKAGLPADRLLMPLNEVNERMPIITLDHCNSCRRVPGTIIHSWFICPLEWVEFTLLLRESGDEEKHIKAQSMAYLQGDKTLAERTYLTHFKSSEHSNRTFCGKCGTHLTFFTTGPGGPLKKALGPFFDITVGTLDQECLEMEGFGPVAQYWHDDGIPWAVNLINKGKKGWWPGVADELEGLKVKNEKEK